MLKNNTNEYDDIIKIYYLKYLMIIIQIEIKWNIILIMFLKNII